MAILMCLAFSAVSAEHAYINFDTDGNMVISGPFDVIIPKPGDARTGGPENSTPSFLDEKLKVSKAGYFADDQFVMVQIETTNAAPGTLSNENLPVHMIGDQEFRARRSSRDGQQCYEYGHNSARPHRLHNPLRRYCLPGESRA